MKHTIIVKPGLSKNERSHISKLLTAKAAVKVGAAYEVADPEGIPGSLATKAASVQQTLPSEQQMLQQLHEDLTWMFNFFQQHKVGKPIELDEREHLKTILARAKAQAIKL